LARYFTFIMKQTYFQEPKYSKKYKYFIMKTWTIF